MPRLPGLPRGVATLEGRVEAPTGFQNGRISVAPFSASLPKRKPSRPFPRIGVPHQLPDESLHPLTGGLWVRFNARRRKTVRSGVVS